MVWYMVGIQAGKRSDIEIPKFIYNLQASCVSNLLGNSIESSANGKNVLEIKICKGPSRDRAMRFSGFFFSFFSPRDALK